MNSKIETLNEEEKKFLLGAVMFCKVDGLELVHEVDDLQFVTEKGIESVFLRVDEVLVKHFYPRSHEIYKSIKTKLTSKEQLPSL